MSSTPASPPPEYPKKGHRSARPRLAASIILTRRRAGRTELLMGRRSAKHVFMPLKYVFPGGRVDRADSFAPLSDDLAPPAREALDACIGEARGRAAAAAAVRELAEETGLLLARPGRIRSRHANWSPFREAGAAPDLSGLDIITRAVTPPGRTRRFDTFFFKADESALLDDRPAKPSPELEDVHWVEFDAARELDLPIITHFVLDEMVRVSEPDPQRPRWTRQLHGRFRIDPLIPDEDGETEFWSREGGQG